MSHQESLGKYPPTVLKSTFEVPPHKRPRTVKKCAFCREQKQRCSYTHGPWPAKCERCQRKGYLCSKPQLASKGHSSKVIHGCLQSEVDKSTSCSLTSQSQQPKPSCAFDRQPTSFYLHHPPSNSKDDCKEAVLLLSLHSILVMAIEELIEITVDMIKPPRRNRHREHTEDSIPELEHAVDELKSLACATKTRMLSLAVSYTLCEAQEALNSLTAPYFHQSHAWGIDEASLSDVQASVASFRRLGHFGLAYVLHIKMLHNDVALTSDEEENLHFCKKRFAEQLQILFNRNYLPIPSRFTGCQLFTPRILVRVPSFAKEILRDDRPDFLGRSRFHILADASISSRPLESLNTIHANSPSLSAIFGRWSPHTVNTTDVLGRTAVHLAVRHCLVSSVMRLGVVGADLHQTCLNGLSLFHIAACHGHTSMIQHLVNNQLYQHEVDRRDQIYRTPFWYAARGSHFDVMDALASGLLAAQVNTEHEDLHNHSPLAIAARDGRADVLSHLFQLRNQPWNTSVLTPSTNEHYIFSYAVQSKDPRCIKLVRKHRNWKYGDEVWQKAMDYADKEHDEALRAELQSLYRSDIPPPPPPGNLTSTLHDPFGQAYYATTLSALTSSGPWLEFSQNVPTWP